MLEHHTVRVGSQEWRKNKSLQINSLGCFFTKIELLNVRVSRETESAGADADGKALSDDRVTGAG